MAVVMGALLLGTLVGVVWARPHDRPQAQDITRKVTLTAGEFIVRMDGYDWLNDGAWVRCQNGSCEFIAPVVFPCLPSVTVERIKLHVLDNNGTFKATAALYRNHPQTQSAVWLGDVSSPYETAGFQTLTSTRINKRVWPSQRAYIILSIDGPAIVVYGVTVEYHRNI
jgi:hypothetical protein